MHVPHCHFFSHPDFTVGFGISPNQLLQFHMVPNDVSSILKQVADYTAGRELHPTPKNFFFVKIVITMSCEMPERTDQISHEN